MGTMGTPAPDLASTQQDEADKKQRQDLKRINVAINQDTVRALQLVMEREGTTLTEAVRRLVGFGDYVYRAIREEGGQLIVRAPDGSTRDVVIL